MNYYPTDFFARIFYIYPWKLLFPQGIRETAQHGLVAKSAQEYSVQFVIFFSL